MRRTTLFATAILGTVISLTSVQVHGAPMGASNSGSNNIYLSQNHSVWWFNGETPTIVNSHYSTTATITLHNAPSGTYTWSISQGASKLDIVNVSNDTKQVFVQSKGLSTPASKLTKDIIVKVTKNAGTVAQLRTVVRAPYRAHHLSTSTDPDATWGYLTLIEYQFQDQFSQSLPEAIPHNEEWTSAVVADYNGQNWGRIAVGVGSTGLPGGKLIDNVGGAPSTASPAPVSPTTAAGASTAVHHWTGNWVVGSVTSGDGLQLRSGHWGGTTYCVWQRYRGYARHE